MSTSLSVKLSKKAATKDINEKAQKVVKPGESITFTVNTKEVEKSRRTEE
jgi:hypothetical protein